MGWTDSQKDAISARAGTVLVAAAAGSGKTAVLVQRAIDRLTDEQDPVSADRMLIVTFTKAAAAEMRTRLETALHKLLRENPANPWLRRQSLLLGQAHIGTVDSFCSEMVREFFHVLNLSPDYKIMSDKQEEELTDAALSEALESAYADGRATLLADTFSGERDDRRLMETVRALYRFMQSHPFPEKWLTEQAERYRIADVSEWQRVILDYADETLSHCIGLCRRGIEDCETGGAVGKALGPTLSADLEQLTRLRELVRTAGWDTAAAELSRFSAARAGAVKAAEKDFLYDRLSALRKEVKSATDDLKKYLYGTTEQCLYELSAAEPAVSGLCELTLDFLRRYAQKKREKNFLDYSDLEHFAIDLFLTPDGEQTEAAREVSGRFDEIMIDEFQDINEVQNALFQAISKDGDNLFMVGDVKQSIYGFRRASPEIFLACRRAFSPYDREHPVSRSSITLDSNFRSRKEVTETVNFVFSRLMSKAAGDVDYTGEEKLVCKAEFPESEGNESEFVFLSRPGGMQADEAEGRWIAKRIKEMMASGYCVNKGGVMTPAQYGDFCILLRSANKHAHLYAQELIKAGVPARATVSGGFFAAAEVNVMLSFLQVIDNPNQDIPILAVLMSQIYGFTAEDCAKLRQEDKRVSVYVSLCRAAEHDPKCARVLGELEELRSLAAAMPSDLFLTMLYERTGYPDLVLAQPAGAERLENLRLLQRYAKEYESSGYHGISGFVRFVERLRRNDSDLQAAELAPDSSNSVSVMSIHKSKGLQFPVCFVAGCGRSFVNDQRADVLLHPQLGLGLRLRDGARSARFTTTAREAIALETARANVAEELRVLYVAMTRAQEKLIMLSSDSKMEKLAEKLSLEFSETGISPYTVRKARSTSHWLMLCALCHPDGKKLREEIGAEDIPVFTEEDAVWRITVEDAPEQDGEETCEQPAEEPCEPDEELLQRLRTAVEYRYPYEQTMGISAKVAASKLAAEQVFEREQTLSRPAWMGEKGMTPAQRGTALHQFIQFMDFSAAAEDPQRELTRLVQKAYLTAEEAEAVDVQRVERFLHSKLGQRILHAERVERERRFTANIPASLAQPELPGAENETVILQGAVDCTFVENGRLHIVDFKTDRVSDVQELVERYASQLRLYAAAMREITGMEIGELLLYSFYRSESIAVEE